MNFLPRIAVAVGLALAVPAMAEDPADQASPLPDDPPSPVVQPLPVPPGSKADQEIWRSAGEVGNQLIALRYTAHGLHWNARNEDFEARLQAAAAADPAAATRLDGIRKQFSQARAASYADLVGRWPVDKTRVCQYQQLSMRSAMLASATQDARAQLSQARDATARCLDVARATLVRVRRSTDAFAAAIGEAEKALALPAEPACKGTLSGMVSGAFACDASIQESADGEATFIVQSRGPIAGVPSYAPGAFRVPRPVRAGTFTLDDLGMGKASVAAEGGVLYTATKTINQRGEVTLVLRSAVPDPRTPGAWIVHGTYRARLVPAGDGKQGEVIVDVSF